MPFGYMAATGVSQIAPKAGVYALCVLLRGDRHTS